MKPKVYTYRQGLTIIDFQKVRDGQTTMGEVTPRESIANFLASVPSSHIDSLLDYLGDSIKFSQERGECIADLKVRLYTDLMALTTESKRNH